MGAYGRAPLDTSAQMARAALRPSMIGTAGRRHVSVPRLLNDSSGSALCKSMSTASKRSAAVHSVQARWFRKDGKRTLLVRLHRGGAVADEREAQAEARQHLAHHGLRQRVILSHEHADAVAAA